MTQALMVLGTFSDIGKTVVAVLSWLNGPDRPAVIPAGGKPDGAMPLEKAFGDYPDRLFNSARISISVEGKKACV